MLLRGNKAASEPSAELARQVFRDFHFSTTDGFEAEARKTVNMYQEWTTPGKYDLDALAVRPWMEKAYEQAQKVLGLVAVRVDNESAKVKGELATARRATDEAIRKAYDVVNALSVLAPTAELTALTTVLLGIEERAKLYYISGGKTSGGSTSGGSSSGDSGSTDNPIPSNPGTHNDEPTPQPNNGSENSGDDELPDPSGGGTDNSE